MIVGEGAVRVWGRGVLGVKEEWIRVPRREHPLWKIDKGGRYLSDGDILLEVEEIVFNDLLDVDAGGMVAKDKGNPITVAGGKRRGEGGSVGDGSDPVEGPVINGAGESSVEEEGGHFGGPLVEAAIIGIVAMETGELEEWSRIFTGSM
eukprot:g24888.t1